MIGNPGNPERTGYQFDYWQYDDHEWLFFAYEAKFNLTLIAVYEPILYPITYHLGAEDVDNKTNPNSYTIENESFVLVDPVRDGFVFTGWTFDEQNIPTKNVVIDKGTYGEKVFTANWYEIGNLTYNSDNTEQDENGIIETFYSLSIYEDSSFLLMEVDLYFDGKLVFLPTYGYANEVSYNVYEFDFVEDNIENMYVRIEDNIFQFL